ncbi:beta-1,3-glucosyltransferase [Anopheles maculipalpis]|uniref:beta-1,3-glucosyltransferase n=1 Tax=Anopheles maculipalpis TaxID=1496333 RepID=UPI002158AF76|nr:beta-1,3-glucosyltransferase [Anopheles maculipalpis]
MYRVALLLPVLLLLQLPSSVAPALAVHELSFLVLSQPARFNAARAQQLKRSIAEQIRELDQEIAPTRPDSVFLTHELFPEQEGAWAITPILGHIRTAILKSTHRTARWLIVCEEQSHVNVSLLAHHLANEDYREKLFLGYPLYDREATIIHHFAFFKNPSSFLYPYLRAGIALTAPLVDHLVQLLADGAARPALSDFFIDAAHEFALAVWQHGQGLPLQPRRYFCAKALPTCAIHPGSVARVEKDEQLSCTDNPTDVDQIMFAVKTCGKYHKDRVPALKNTWTKYVQHLRYFSDVDDPSIPTVATSVPNYSAGHCAKTLEILQLIGDEIRYNGSLQAIRWVMLVDDDTILSSSSLARFLSCYDPSRDLYLGERYGYHLMGPAGGGYNYVTGGGGIVLSVAILDALQQTCECPSASSPDDMILAACLQRLGIRPIHSSLFHQARPSDYAPELLDRQDTVSFHKHWQIDPQQVYNRWFRQQDERYSQLQARSTYSYPTVAPNEDICKHSNSVHKSVESEPNLCRHKDHHLDPYLRPTRPNASVRNENNSVREQRIGPTTTNEDENKRSPQQSNHNDRHQHPERVLRFGTKATNRNVPPMDTHNPTSGGGPAVDSTGQPPPPPPPTQQHIPRKHLCESNELQSNGNGLLLRRQNLQESTNIIKHTDL